MVTGTPVLNRPVELYPILRSLFPTFLGKYINYYDFAYKFCAGHQGAFGFDATGASCLPELAAILSPLMLRRMKSDVLKELPSVTYDKIYLDPSDKLIALTEMANKEFDVGHEIGEVSSIHRAIGIIKATAAINHIREMLDTKSKVLVFLWHSDVCNMIAEAFPGKCVRHTGAESATEKERSVRRFINDSDVQLFLGNIKSTGYGVDGLQEVCDTAIFVEMSYVPKELEQCIDRLSRMGQKNPVQVQFLVAENSIDERVIGTLAEKAKNINTIMGDRKDGVTNEIKKTKEGIEFVATTCQMCKRPTEMTELKRVLKLSVCPTCRKIMECLV